MLDIVAMIEKDLSEPYSIFTYRYFIHNWPDLCFLAFADGRMIGNIVCKADRNKGAYRGYIAMLAVEKSYRKHGIGELCIDLTHSSATFRAHAAPAAGSTLAMMAIDRMYELGHALAV